MRRFRFTPRHCQSDSDLELLDLRDSGKHQIFSQICRDHPACGCAPAYSSWNCDGEILNHTAIDVRCGGGRRAGEGGCCSEEDNKQTNKQPGLTEASSVWQGSLPPHQAVCSGHRGAGRVQRRPHQPLCTLVTPPVRWSTHRVQLTWTPVVSAASSRLHDLDSD